MRKIFSIIFICSGFLALAQWDPAPYLDNSICVQVYNQINPKLVSDLKGGAIIVWEDHRNGTKADIYAQRIGADGIVKWDVNGKIVCNDTSDQSNPVIVVDSLGGAFIVWEDSRGAKKNLYAQYVDSSGNMLWANNGITVASRNFEQKNAKLLNDLNNGVLVFWQDSVGGAYDIYGQRLDASGTAIWSGGIGICTMALSQVNPKAQVTNAGDIYVTWQDKRNGSDYDIYVQKLSLAGAPQWTSNGINISNIAGTQANPKIAIDAGNNPVIVWQDKRNGSDYDVYAQQLNPSGSAQWAANGTAVCSLLGSSQSAVDILTRGVSGGIFIIWKDARNGTNNIDIYGQFLNLSGAAQWTSNGIPLANNAGNQLSPNSVSDGAGGMIISYQDSSGGDWNIRSQRINTSGTLLWNAAGVDIGTAANYQVNQDNVAADAGSCIYVFEDKRNGTDYDIYAYKLGMSGNPVTIQQINHPSLEANISPNPSSGKVNIHINTKNNLSGRYFVRDCAGRQLLCGTLNTSEFMIDQLPAGMYHIEIITTDGKLNGKFVIAE